MSLKPDTLRASAEQHLSISSVNDTGSENGCYNSTLNRIQRRPARQVGILDAVDLDSDVAYRFWQKVDKRGPTECWPWLASSMDSSGHGQFTFRLNGKQHHVYAHRAAWELVHGESIPAGKNLNHTCDVAGCCNSAHVYVGTQQENLRDARERGRLDEKRARTQKFTPAERLAIFELPARRGLVTDLARRYGVSKVCICLIRQGRFVRGPIAAAPQQSPNPIVERVPSVQLEIRGSV